MPFKGSISKSPITFNKHQLHLQWPRIWIIILGVLLIFLNWSMAGMEIGHTVIDFRRSAAFGGFILFIPLLICGILVLVTAWLPRLLILRITVISCYIMLFLCMVLIAYNIIGLIDPTRCFFLDCSAATVNISNSTTNVVTSGWPLNIAWPSYFQTNMNAIRIFQSVQILCAGLFMLVASLYLLTYYIYRHIGLHQQTTYNADRQVVGTYETNRTGPMKGTNHVSQSYPSSNVHHKTTTYTIEGDAYTSSQNLSFQSPIATTKVTPRKKTKSKTFVRARPSSVDYGRLCTRCNREPRMILTSSYERHNFFPNLCLTCNNDLVNDRRKPVYGQSRSNRSRKP